MWLKDYLFTPYYSPDEQGGSGTDFVNDAIDTLGDFEPDGDSLDDKKGDKKPEEDLDLKPDEKDDLEEDDLDDDKPIRDIKASEDKPDDDADEDKDKKDEEKKSETEQKEVEAKDLTARALKESYPKIYKEFPELKDVIFQNREYNKIFGSVEDAVEAKEKAEVFDGIAETTLKGDPTELIAALEKTERGRTEQFATNLISQIRKTNADMYYRVTDPVIASALKAAETHAAKSGDKNLLLATKYLATFVFGDQEIPSFGAKKELDPERAKFEAEKAAEAESRYNEHQKTIYDYTERKLDAMIRDGLDPDNVYNNFVKEALADKVMSRIGQTLKADRAFQGQMAALWKRAHKEGFSREAKQRIAHTYLAKAKRVMPAIRNKMRGEAPINGAGNNSGGKEREKKILTSGGQGGEPRKVIPNDPKKINWSKVTDEDILASS